MEALADKLHKQGEHIPQHCNIATTSLQHPYISSSDMLGDTINIHCYLCRDGCVKCNNVVDCALLVLCTLSASVAIYPFIPTFGRFITFEK